MITVSWNGSIKAAILSVDSGIGIKILRGASINDAGKSNRGKRFSGTIAPKINSAS